MKFSYGFLAVALILCWSVIALPQTVLQGGDNIGNAFPIPNVPFNDNGTTVGYTDDYTGNCGNASGAPDVVYSFVPTYDMLIMASLCMDSNFDTRLYIFEDTPANIVACNDDYCSNQYSDYVSAIPCLQIYAGHTYYFVIDGYGSASGNYSLVLTLPVPGIPITGQVTEYEGGPLSGVYIRVLQDDSQVWQDTTYASGYYEVIYLPPGRYTVEASKAGYITQTSDPVYITACENARVDFVLQRDLPPPIGSIAGIVREDDGSTPIGAALVRVFQDGMEIRWDTTDTEGQFIFQEMQLGLYDLEASANGFVPERQYGIEVLMDQTTQVEFQLQDSVILCPYTPGDVNGSSIFNGLDVTYLVGYFKGGPHPTLDCHPYCPNQPDPFYAAADMNSDCVVNGLDIGFFVMYLKGRIPGPGYCPDCPPSGR